MRSGIWISCAIALSFALGMMVASARGAHADKDETRVTGIGGIFMKARDPDKLAQWYEEHLEIPSEKAASGPNSPRYHLFEWTEKGSAHREGTTVWSLFPEDTKYFGSGSAPFMINYRVANLDRLLTRLGQQGVHVEDKIEDEANGRFAWATDPEGNRFELWEPK
jgi:predicted enzyme related to lactoylglutathione lyase